MGNVWEIYGKYMENIWEIYGEYMGNIWRIYGECMGNVWDIYGKYMGNVWEMYGKYMGNIWEIYIDFFRDDLWEIPINRPETAVKTLGWYQLPSGKRLQFAKWKITIFNR